MTDTLATAALTRTTPITRNPIMSMLACARARHARARPTEQADTMASHRAEGGAWGARTPRAGVPHGLPRRGEGGVHPGEGAPECQLHVEGAVHDAGQEDEECDEGHEVARRERLCTRC